MPKIFKQRVWKALKRVPRGKVTTYALLARAVHVPRGARAVGHACNKNPFAPHVPCHRVVKSDGSLGGYATGLRRKRALLEKEGVHVKRNRIVDFEKKVFRF